MATISSGLQNFSEQILKYFLDFIETDFKRQQAPRRKIALRNDAGFRTGFHLRKYRTLFIAIWECLGKPGVGDILFKIPRNKYITPLSEAIKDLIFKYINDIPSTSFERIKRVTLDCAIRHKTQSIKEPESYINKISVAFTESNGEQIIAPLLATLDEVFKSRSYSAIESAYELEADLVQAISSPLLEHLPKAINTFIVTEKTDEIDQLFADFFDEKEIKERIMAVFESLATSDAYSELRDLVHYQNTGSELQFYLYACDVKFEGNTFPLFYFPGKVTQYSDSNDYIISIDPHYYVNRRAIDYILGKQDDSALLLASAPIDKRIVHRKEGDPHTKSMQTALKRLTSVSRLPQNIDLSLLNYQTVSTTTIRLTNNIYFAVFDKADEALLNDYEGLILAIQENQLEASNIFNDILKRVLFDNPAPIHDDIDKEWSETAIENRLVVESPIPLNEEQQKIIKAIMNDKCRFITVEGPPGTGKSHTITAIAFDSIMKGQNVLILSDKQEALDVVEDKLTQALTSVRPVDEGEKFPNPILRLGKSGSFNHLVKKGALDKVRNFTRANNNRKADRMNEKSAILTNLRAGIHKTATKLTKVKHEDVEKFLKYEKALTDLDPCIINYLHNPTRARSSKEIEEVFKNSNIKTNLTDLIDNLVNTGGINELSNSLKALSIAEQIDFSDDTKEAIKLFPSMDKVKIAILSNYILQYQQLRWPLFGFFFTKKKARDIDMLLGMKLHCQDIKDLHLNLDKLRLVIDAVHKILAKLDENEYSLDFCGEVYKVVRNYKKNHYEGASLACKLVDKHIFWYDEKTFASMQIGSTKIPLAHSLYEIIIYCAMYVNYWECLRKNLGEIPQFDYVADKKLLEHLCTLDMADKIDNSFLQFVDHHKADVTTLATMIRSKQQFPKEKFDGLKQAFSCMIAGIREFAEYVPLSKEMFDLVIIDEASQVSVAQAFPAILRTKKVVVFGDMNQYSNVKSMQASNMLNQSHRRRIEQAFKDTIEDKAETLVRLQQFDVKKSILEFFEMIANYQTMLKKHFRGYQELISYSSKNFYNHELQAIKLRGKPLDEIIEFTTVKHEKKSGNRKNTNASEVKAILEELHRMIDEEEHMSVGVITPFREQQQLLSKELHADEYSDQFDTLLRLKIMTFDSCQGEERDIIIYSMVATEESDLLNYIFPVDLKKAMDEEYGALKRQRLNVGFSRAKEKMHFFISKPIDKFYGSIGQALRHYNALLKSRPIPLPEDTDPASPMEKKILDWIVKSSFFEKHQHNIELIAQFPVGDYLKQLDPFYQHPSYRSDFLLRYYGDETVNIIIEYDGFLEHFIEHGKVHQGNYDRFYRPEDIERQMVIESYGYKFLRLNKFNIGDDPISTISSRLSLLLKNAERKDFTPQTSGRIKKDAISLANGDLKECPKCKRIFPKENFHNPKLKSGISKNCKDCNSRGKSSYNGRPKRYRRWY